MAKHKLSLTDSPNTALMPESVALEGFSSFVFQTRDTEIVEERVCAGPRGWSAVDCLNSQV